MQRWRSAPAYGSESGREWRRSQLAPDMTEAEGKKEGRRRKVKEAEERLDGWVETEMDGGEVGR